jgi:hypothetical protein
LPSSGLVEASAEGEAVGHAVQKAPQPVVADQRRGLAHQDEKRRLEGILGGVGVVQHPPAHPQDQRSVTAHQHFHRRLVALGQETLQELLIAQRRSRVAADQLPHVVNERVEMGVGHARVLGALRQCHYPLSQGSRGNEEIAYLEEFRA